MCLLQTKIEIEVSILQKLQATGRDDLVAVLVRRRIQKEIKNLMEELYATTSIGRGQDHKCTSKSVPLRHAEKDSPIQKNVHARDHGKLFGLPIFARLPRSGAT